MYDHISKHVLFVLGVLIRSSLWLRFKNIMPLPDDDVSVLFCSIISVSN